METKAIERSIEIKAPASKVWEVLTNDHLNRQWFAEFCPGTFAETTWELESKVIFNDGNGGGLIGEISDNIPNKLLAIRYTGLLENGAEDYTSGNVEEIIGGREVYTLTENGNTTTLDIIGDMSTEMYEMMLGMWDKALQKIKELAEER